MSAAWSRIVRSRVGRLVRRPVVIIDDFEVQQDGRWLEILMTAGPGVVPRTLWARRTGTGEWTRLGDLSAQPATLTTPKRWSARLDLQSFPSAISDDGASYSVHLELDHVLPQRLTVGEYFPPDLNVELSDVIDGQVVAHYRPPLGQAVRTHVGSLHAVEADGVRREPHVDAYGGISVAVDRTVTPYGLVYVRRLAVRSGVLRMCGRINARDGDLEGAALVLKGRSSGHRVECSLPIHPDPRRTQKRFGQRWYRYDLRVDCAGLARDPQFVEDTYDAWLRLTSAQNPEGYEVRVGRTSLVSRSLTRPGWAQAGGRAVAVTPYYTFKAKRTSFTMSVFAADDFRYLRRQVRLRHVNRLLHGRRDVWLIGERPYKAQDTGYWFYRYLREQHPEVEAYYVIAPDSLERGNVTPYGNVIDFGSKEHIRLTLLATKIVSSHNPDFLYPLRTKEFDRAIRATKVFLQHGVMGTKWMANLYGKWVANFDADVFVVSSEREREYIIGDFGYAPDEVVVTGLSRFDSLFAADVPTEPKQILIMPTWRDWLQDADLYRGSEYHRTWSQLLHDERLQTLVQDNDLEIIFCLHPNMQQFRYLFADVPARVISQGEVDVQRLLKQSAMLITDYSSVGFDFSFLDKPVAYFQFDREQFLGIEGSHLDLDEELPGPIYRSTTSVIDELRDRLADGFTMPSQYRERAARFLAHRDRSSSERIYDQARRMRPRRDLAERVAGNELVATVPRYLRRHRLYFPAMRRAFRLAKLLPARSDVVLFESGVGKQYADSPRYVYEELVRTRPELTKVWAYSGRLPVRDPNTRVIERLSPRYFWYLARAKYWVNNQSFPHYITRRRDGVYLQTWHGTPLKRMLHDLDQVHGRDSGYLKRATAAAAQWSILASPNHYTTEIMRSAFRYTGETLEVGYPRNDVLHSPDRDRVAARIRARLDLRPGQRVILYAPTFRDDQISSLGRFTFELPFDLERMQAGLGENTVLLLRMHVLVAARIDIPLHLRDAIRDVSRYPEIQELYLASDVLVTDYSSVFFDFAALRRPMVFYAYDLENYRSTLRGFYLDYERDLPGPIVETEADLIATLAALPEPGDAAPADDPSAERREAFLQRFCGDDDGHAAERVVKAVFGR